MTTAAQPGVDRDRPVVFVGPSVAPDAVLSIVPDAIVQPPVTRTALYQAREDGHAHFLLIDGSFTHGFAVSPREVVDVLRDGATVLGASSMGAIRAAECWPAGMEGVGLVYHLYQRGVVQSDDEVAVATDADDQHRALSCALINVRCGARRAVRRGLLAEAEADAIVAGAEELHFTERTWRRIFASATVFVDDSVQQFLRGVDVKHADALRGLGRLREQRRTGRHARGSGAGRPTIARLVRYPGHDPNYGRAEDELRAVLLRWVFGSGRYQRYMWPLVVGDPTFATSAAASRSPDALRHTLAEALARALDDVEALAVHLWRELAYLDELETELARWYAVEAMAASATCNPTPGQRRRAREQIAIAHGATSWTILVSFVDGGRLLGALPMEWIEAACDRTAQASAAMGEATPQRDRTARQGA